MKRITAIILLTAMILAAAAAGAELPEAESPAEGVMITAPLPALRMPGEPENAEGKGLAGGLSGFGKGTLIGDGSKDGSEGMNLISRPEWDGIGDRSMFGNGSRDPEDSWASFMTPIEFLSGMRPEGLKDAGENLMEKSMEGTAGLGKNGQVSVNGELKAP